MTCFGVPEQGDHHVDDVPGHLEEHAALVRLQLLDEALVSRQVLGQPGAELVDPAQLALAARCEHLLHRRHVAEQVDHLHVQMLPLGQVDEPAVVVEVVAGRLLQHHRPAALQGQPRQLQVLVDPALDDDAVERFAQQSCSGLSKTRMPGTIGSHRLRRLGDDLRIADRRSRRA